MRLVAFLLALTIPSLPAASSTTAAAATLAKPVYWGSPDQPWGRRRPVTAADRAAIQLYRSGRKPLIYTTTFADPVRLQAEWTIEQDDNPTMASCRRPGSVETSAAGLTLKNRIGTDCRTARWSTGHIASKAKYAFGFFEIAMKIAGIPGENNAYWLTTDDNFEIDIGEASYPGNIHIGLQYWPPDKTEQHVGVGWGAAFRENLSQGFHDLGVLWTSTDMIFEVDGAPVAAAVINHAVKGPAKIRLSTALAGFAGKVPDHPEGHGMVIKSLRVFAP
jgi:Glycosyl hydrolases family 16